MTKRNQPLSQAEQLATLRAHLHTLRGRCASLERKVKRLEAACPCSEHEIEIARLERFCTDLAQRWEEAETDVLRLRRLVEGRAA